MAELALGVEAVREAGGREVMEQGNRALFFVFDPPREGGDTSSSRVKNSGSRTVPTCCACVSTWAFHSTGRLCYETYHHQTSQEEDGGVGTCTTPLESTQDPLRKRVWISPGKRPS